MGEDDNTNVIVLPDQVFVQATEVGETLPMQRIVSKEEMEQEDPVYAQDEALVKPWVDTHRLKKVDGMWYKEGK